MAKRILGPPTSRTNAMLQPAGRVCGLDASLRIFLHSSPIICAVDAVFILLRFVFYMYEGHGVNWTARAILAARAPVDEDFRPEDATSEDPKPGWLMSQQRNYFLLSLVFSVGVLTQFVKLMACSGVPWTQAWACFYMLSFVVVEVTKRLGSPQKDAKTKPTENEVIQCLRPWLDWWEQACGYAAIILQLGILASVDMIAVPPNPILKHQWISICARFSAHFAACLVHLPFMIHDIDGRKTLADHHWGVPLHVYGCTLYNHCHHTAVSFKQTAFHSLDYHTFFFRDTLFIPRNQDVRFAL
jgi:hypothetical protein